MANTPGLVDWALDNAAALKLKVLRLTWIETWLPGYFDYHIDITIDGELFSGRGTDQDESLAFTKALAESLERASCRGLPTPWATAAHPDYDEAALRSYYELLGMDRALCHHFSRSKMKIVQEELLAPLLPLSVLQRQLRKNRLVLRFFELRPASDARIAVAFGWSSEPGTKFGVLSGFGCSSNFDAALRQAAVECLRKMGAIFVAGMKPDSDLSELARAKSPWWHVWAMSQTKRSRSFLNKYLLPSSTEEIVLLPENISYNDIKCRKISRLSAYFHDMPLKIVQASSRKLLRPHFGNMPFDSEFVRRVEVFAGHPVNINSDPPHFYG